MGNADDKAEEKAEKEEASPTIIYQIGGDFVQGDKTSMGDVSGSAIGVGAGASATVQMGGASGAAAGAGAEGQELDERTVYKQLVDGFNLSEIEDLCFLLGVDFENLGGTGKSGKARELVLYMDRRGRLGELAAKIKELRGN